MLMRSIILTYKKNLLQKVTVLEFLLYPLDFTPVIAGTLIRNSVNTTFQLTSQQPFGIRTAKLYRPAKAHTCRSARMHMRSRART